MEGLADAAGGIVEASTHRFKIRVPATVLDDRLEGREARAQVTLEHFANTGNITIRCPASLEDMAFDRVKILESLYRGALLTGQVPPAPEGGAAAVNSFRLPALAQYNPNSRAKRKERDHQGMGERAEKAPRMWADLGPEAPVLVTGDATASQAVDVGGRALSTPGRYGPWRLPRGVSAEDLLGAQALDRLDQEAQGQ